MKRPILCMVRGHDRWRARNGVSRKVTCWRCDPFIASITRRGTA